MRKFFSILLLIVFVALFPTTLLSVNISVAFTTKFLKNTFRQVDLYRRLVSIDPQKVVDFVSKGQSGDAIELSSEKVGAVLGYISPEDLQYTVEKNLDSSIRSAKKGGSYFSVDLTAIKKSVAGKNGDPEIKQTLLQIPDIYTPPQSGKGAQKFFLYVLFGNFATYAGPIFTFLCLLFSLILWPGWKGRLRIFGTPAFIFGVAILIGYLVGRRIPVPKTLIADFIDSILRDILIAFKTKILSVYLWEGIILSVVGLALWVISFFVPGEKTIKAVASPVEQKVVK